MRLMGALNNSFNDSLSSIDVPALLRSESGTTAKESSAELSLSSSCSNMYLDASYAGPLSGLAATYVAPDDASVLKSGGSVRGTNTRRRRSSLLKRGDEDSGHPAGDGSGTGGAVRGGRNIGGRRRSSLLLRKLDKDIEKDGGRSDIDQQAQEETDAVTREIIEDKAHFQAMKEMLQQKKLITSLGVNVVCAEYIKRRTEEEVEMRRRSSDVVASNKAAAARSRPVQELRRRFTVL